MNFDTAVIGAALVAVVLATGCGTSGTDSPSPGTEASTDAAGTSNTEAVTREVVQRHLRTFGEGDLEGILADYADDAVMFTPNGPIQGKEELRTAFEQFIAEWGQEGTTFELTEETYVGEHGYVNWTAETADNVYDYGVDGFTVRDSQIVVQFFGAHITPK